MSLKSQRGFEQFAADGGSAIPIIGLVDSILKLTHKPKPPPPVPAPVFQPGV